jgi:hypothetical protein
MLVAAICLAGLLAAIGRGLFARQSPVDRAEIRVIGRYADQVRKEQIQPFDQ